MNRHWSETPLAWFTLFGTTVHFILETWYHIVWGQPLQALVVDYICNVLMVLGAVVSLSRRPNGSAAGLLAAGWAFALGFGWRSVFGRLALRDSGLPNANNEADFVVYLIMAALFTVAITLIWALWLALRQGKTEI